MLGFFHDCRTLHSTLSHRVPIGVHTKQNKTDSSTIEGIPHEEACYSIPMKWNGVVVPWSVGATPWVCPDSLRIAAWYSSLYHWVLFAADVIGGRAVIFPTLSSWRLSSQTIFKRCVGSRRQNIEDIQEVCISHHTVIITHACVDKCACLYESMM